MLLKGQIYSKYWNNPIFRLKNNPTPNSSQFLIRQDIGNNCLRADALQISRPFKKYLSLGSQRDNNKNQRSNGNIFYIRKSIRSS